ncbi:MAG: STN domain-containing protein [Cyclobacteriaceae bacterium]|jgi:hypothetical protein|nr:hypothetical protein [Cytophagales bacterium]HNP75608.1 STN domain-containing protein [Cyclobacteriaceae bacterium]
MNRFIAILSLFLALPLFSRAQGTPILERRITLQATNEKIPVVLNRMGVEGRFSFSYNAALIDESQLISLQASNKTVREILHELFHDSFDFKEKGNHLILQKAPVKNLTPATLIISGYVEDGTTHARLADASIYDKKSITSVITDEYGYFRMKVSLHQQSAAISVSKRNYRDTLITITPGTPYITIVLMPIVRDSVISVPAKRDSAREELPMPYQEEPNVRNIRDTLYRDIQVSLLPFLGSNSRLSGNTINNYSINMLGGYSLGTRNIELGFFVNMDRGDVSWLQIAGIGNMVGGRMYGIQLSGFYNINGGETKAVQVSGFTNVNLSEVQGFQIAGFSNVNVKASEGLQVAGFTNVGVGRSLGAQIAGAANIQIGMLKGSQFAGVTNIATDHVRGSQVAGLFNYGHVVHGTQIGLVNVADTLGGVPIGLISYVRSGYHKLEFSADEVFHANVAFRTGVSKFYNIILAGVKPDHDFPSNPVWTFGYGLGTAPRLTRWLDLNLDATAQHVNQGAFTHELSLLNKIHVGLDFKLARKFSLYGGVTLNGYLTHNGYAGYPVLFTDYQPTVTHEQNWGESNLKMWWGAKVGLRFL